MAGPDGRIGHHDLASGPGLDAAVRLQLGDRADRRHAFWERQVHACVGALVAKALMTVDEMRRCIEGLEPEVYAKAPYYEKWAVGIATVLLERNVISNGDLDEKLGPAEEVEPAQPFATGAVVRVRQTSHATRWRRPHLRTPGFVHGVCGVVERYVGDFKSPEKLAFGGQCSSKLPLYVVRFDWRSVCDVDGAEAANGKDAVTCEIYQSWLEEASEQDLASQREGYGKRKAPVAALGTQPDCKRPRAEHGAGHGDHGHEHGDHVHEERSAVEQRAVDAEIPCPAIARALVEVLQAKGIVSAEDLRRIVEKVDAADLDRGALGRLVVARAWMDPAFKARLLQDGSAACAEIGLNVANPTAPTQLVVVEQTPDEHHFIVCTLCSCYPLTLLGLSPDWYKSREYRSRAVREPRAVLREFGTEVPMERRVTVHDSTADCRYLVLPQRPAGTEGWSEEKLQEVITRDSMIGVTILPSKVG